MEIRVDNVSQLSLNRQGKLLYNYSEVDLPWRKTLYRIEGNQLICRHFNIVGLFLHLLGYKKEFNSENLTSYLAKNIKALNGKDSVTQAVAFEALGNVSNVKRNFFEHNYESENEAIALFKEQGLDVNASNIHYGGTALMMACSKGEFELAKYLIEQGANVNHKEEDTGRVAFTALHNAFHSKNLNVIELLIDKGANLNAQDSYGHSGFYHLVSAYIQADPSKGEDKAKLLELIRKSLDKQPDFSLKGNNGTVLEMACQKGSLEMVQLLKQHGAKMDVNPNFANRYIENAIQSGNVELVRWILEQGATLDYPRKYQILMAIMDTETPLVMAIRSSPNEKMLAMVQLLLEKGQDPNERNPLFHASNHGSLELVKLLVKKGATGFKDALEVAKKGNKPDIVAYLESVMSKA